jgi:hypothetical protein
MMLMMVMVSMVVYDVDGGDHDGDASGGDRDDV